MGVVRTNELLGPFAHAIAHTPGLDSASDSACGSLCFNGFRLFNLMLNVFTRSFNVVVFTVFCCCYSFATFSFQLLLSSLGFCSVVVSVASVAVAATVSVFDMRVDKVGQAIRIKYPKKLNSL